jgi:Sulfatase
MPNLDPHTVRTRLLVAMVLSLQIFFLLPATIYLGNLSEFAAGPWAILKILSIPLLLLVTAIFLVGGLLKEVRHDRMLVLLSTISLLLWVQGYVYVWDYGPLDGRNIDWHASDWRGWLDLGTWVTGLGLAFIFARRLRKILVTFAIAVCVLQFFVLTATAVLQTDELKKRSISRTTPNALAEIARFSSTKNVIHIILDSFQSDIFNEIAFTNPAAEGYRNALSGFTFFEEHLGAFPYTYFAVPALLGGPIYRNHMTKSRFASSVYRENTILNIAHTAGYEIDIATPVNWLLDFLALGSRTNVFDTAEGSHINQNGRAQHEAIKLLDLALFRITPHRFKRYVYRDQRWLVQDWIPGSALMSFPYLTDNLFLQTITKRAIADRSKPVYKFFHLMGPHAPMVVTPDCLFVGRALPRIRETVVSQSRCTLDYAIELLDKLREIGVYENAMIVLMGDHGGWIPPTKYTLEEIVDGVKRYRIDAPIVGLASPLMLVKPPGATGPLKVSNVLSSLTDTAQTINMTMGLGGNFDGTSVFDLTSGDKRTRRFQVYKWQKSDYTSDYVLPIQEFIVRGSHFESDSWRLSGTYRAPGDEGLSAFQ